MTGEPGYLLVGAFTFLYEMVLLFIASVAIAYLSYRVRLVPIIGFLLAGVVIGPGALGLVDDLELVNTLAEIGVILLLFTIGVEFSLAKLSRIGKAIFVGGGLQVILSTAVVVMLLVPFGISWKEAAYTGCLVALSSTAVVLSLLGDRAETDAPHGRLSLAVLIFQDLAIIVMVLLVPMLAGTGGTPLEVVFVLGKAVLLIALVIVLARRVVPWVMEKIAQTRRQELFLLTVVTICFGTAALSSLAGVSLALGAFLAGLVVSESRYSEQAMSEILPLKTIFNAVFFVSVGMLLDVGFVVANPLLVLGVAVGVVLIKLLTTAAGILVLGYPLRIAAAASLALAQIGEFSFVLERAGRLAGLAPMGLETAGGQTFIAVAVLLLLFTPSMVQVAPRFGWMLSRWTSDAEPESMKPSEPPSIEDHTIIVGYGPAGRRLVQVLKDKGIPFKVIEMNPASVKEMEEYRIYGIYGDAGRRHILELAGIERAKLLVIAVNDSVAVPRIIQLARYLNPTLEIIARTRFLDDVEPLHRVGADIVVPEEMETTVRLFSHVLGAYMVPAEEIERQVRTLRKEDYRVVRGSIQEAHLMVLQGLDEDGLHTRAVAIRAGAPAAGKSLEELALRRRYGLTVLAVRREGKTIGSPAGDFRAQPGDRLVLVGTSDRFSACADLFRSAPPLEAASPD